MIHVARSEDSLRLGSLAAGCPSSSASSGEGLPRDAGWESESDVLLPSHPPGAGSSLSAESVFSSVKWGDPDRQARYVCKVLSTVPGNSPAIVRAPERLP